MLAVVVLPWVPETAQTVRPGNTFSASHCGPDIQGIFSASTYSTLLLPRDSALPMITRSGAGSRQSGS